MLIGYTPIQNKQFEKAALFQGNHFFYFYMTWSLRAKIEYHFFFFFVPKYFGKDN